MPLSRSPRRSSLTWPSSRPLARPASRPSSGCAAASPPMSRSSATPSAATSGQLPHVRPRRCSRHSAATPSPSTRTWVRRRSSLSAVPDLESRCRRAPVARGGRGPGNGHSGRAALRPRRSPGSHVGSGRHGWPGRRGDRAYRARTDTRHRARARPAGPGGWGAGWGSGAGAVPRPSHRHAGRRPPGRGIARQRLAWDRRCGSERAGGYGRRDGHRRRSRASGGGGRRVVQSASSCRIGSGPGRG